MESNFTPRMQQVFELARAEAERSNNNFIGTEHLLLGVIGLGSGIAANILVQHGLTLETVRQAIERCFGKSPEQSSIKQFPFTPRARLVIERAEKEANKLQHTYVDTEHLLLSLVAQTDGLAPQLVKELGLDRDKIKTELEKEMTR